MIPWPLVSPAVAVCGWCKLTSDLDPHTCWGNSNWSSSMLISPKHFQVILQADLSIKLDSLSPIHKFIGQAMSWGKYWARRYVEPNIFPTHGETNKFVYWTKNRIQFYHYYVLRILCPISQYTFLNKQIWNKRENMSLNYQIMEKEPVRVLTLFLCNGTKKHREPHREIGYHLKIKFL